MFGFLSPQIRRDYLRVLFFAELTSFRMPAQEGISEWSVLTPEWSVFMSEWSE